MRAGAPPDSKIQQQPQSLERLHAFQQMGLVDHQHGVPPLLAVGGQEPLDSANADLQAGVEGCRLGAVQFIGQIGEQFLRRHLRKAEADQRRESLAQTLGQHGRDERLADAGRAGQQRAAAMVLDGVAEFAEGRLMRLAGIIEARVGDVLERLLLQLPIGFIHGPAALQGTDVNPRPRSSPRFPPPRFPRPPTLPGTPPDARPT